MKENPVSSKELLDLEEQLKVRKEEIDPILHVGFATDQQLAFWKNDLNLFAEDFNEIRIRMVEELKEINSMDSGGEKERKGMEYNQKRAQFDQCLYTYYIPLKYDVFKEINTREDQQEEKDQQKRQQEEVKKNSPNRPKVSPKM